MEDTFIQTNGIRLHLVQSGSSGDPLVVLLHGFPEFWYGWRRQIEYLSRAGYWVVAPDQRGYNLSEKPHGVSAYGVNELVKDVIGILTALGREKCYLVGHDWGAAVAWETALQYPTMIEKLAILNVPHPDIMQRFLRSNLKQIRKSWYIFSFQLPWLAERILRKNDFDALKKALTHSSRPGTFSEADIQMYVETWAKPGALTAMLNWYRAAFRESIHLGLNPTRVNLRMVRVPTLILWGKNDIALSSEMAHASVELCDQGSLIMFEDASHWVQHDEAQAVSDNLLNFLR